MPAKDHPVFKRPANLNIKIWRYMDFTKFVSMLERQGLFFSRADKLGDPFEGSVPRTQVGYPYAGLMKHDPNMKGDELKKAVRDFSKAMEAQRKWTAINCWHMNDHESAAMWRLYAKTDEAISICSTFNKLRESPDEKCYLGVVKYIDYDKEWLPDGNLLYPFVHKRLSFAHERELRAVIHGDSKAVPVPEANDVNVVLWLESEWKGI
jgi:hypothetical protein